LVVTDEDKPKSDLNQESTTQKTPATQSTSQIIDPLSDPLSSGPLDPLSAPTTKNEIVKQSSFSNVATSPISTINKPIQDLKSLEDSFVPWKAKKAGILSEYTTDELVGITVVSISKLYEK
jgi:hypothetical protein